MKKVFPIFLFLLTGCLSDISDELPYSGALVEKTLSGSTELITKTGVSSTDGTTINFKWSAGDYIWAEGFASEPIESDALYADFHFTQIPSSDTYDVFYNLTGTDNEAKIPSFQSQKAAYELNLGKNGNLGYAKTQDDIFTLKHANSFLWFNPYSSDVTAKISSISICTNSKEDILAGEASFIGSKFINLKGTNKLTLNFEGEGAELPKTNQLNQVFAAAVVFPIDCSTSTLHISYKFSDGTEFTEVKKGIKFENGLTYRLSTHITKEAPYAINILPEDNIKPEYVKYGKERNFEISFAGWTPKPEDIKITPIEGWDMSIDVNSKQLKVIAPAQYSPGMNLTEHIHIQIKGQEVLNEEVYIRDFSNPKGTYIILEGNMTSENGSVAFIDQYERYHINFYEEMNGTEIGNVVQDMYIANDRVYFITQNGKSSFDGPETAGGGDGRFIVCDMHTMKRLVKRNLPFYDAYGNASQACWPQHIVVVSPTKGYIQYSVPMETHSGIRSINISNNTISREDIPNTYGLFTKTGASKSRMTYSRGYVYAGRGESLIIIDPKTDDVVKTFNYPNRQFKDLAKGYDGNIYAVFTGKFYGNTGMTGNVNYTEPAKVVVIEDLEVINEIELPEEIELRAGTACPSILLCASFTKPEMYFIGTQIFSAETAVKYNYETEDYSIDYITPWLDNNTKFGKIIYGYMGVHPTTEKLWVGKSTYTKTGIHSYDASGSTAKEIDYFPHLKASPAGVDFVYRFSEEWINR